MSRAVGVPSPVLDGIFHARRPTGPVLGLLVVVVCLLIGPLPVLIGLLAVFGVSPGILLGTSYDLPAQLTLMLSFAGASVLLFLWVGLKEGRSPATLGFLPARGIAPKIGVGALVAVVLLAIPLGANVLGGWYVATIAPGPPVAAALLALTGFVVQACTEEVLTRGYLLQVAYRKWGLLAAVAFQAVVFALLHSTNFDVSAVALVNILLIGVVLGMWALVEGSLWGVCAFHTTWNWAQGNIAGIQVSGMDLRATLLDMRPAPGSSQVLTGGGFGIEGSVLTTAVLLVATLIVSMALKSRLAR